MIDLNILPKLMHSWGKNDWSFTFWIYLQTDDLQGHIIICGFGRIGQVGIVIYKLCCENKLL